LGGIEFNFDKILLLQEQIVFPGELSGKKTIFGYLTLLKVWKWFLVVTTKK